VYLPHDNFDTNYLNSELYINSHRKVLDYKSILIIRFPATEIN